VIVLGMAHCLLNTKVEYLFTQWVGWLQSDSGADIIRFLQKQANLFFSPLEGHAGIYANAQMGNKLLKENLRYYSRCG